MIGRKKSNVGAIVGGTIGGVAFLILTGFAIFFFMYRHRRQAHRVTAAQYDAGQEIEKVHGDGSVEPFPLPSTTPTTVRFACAPESTIGSDRLSFVPGSMPMLGHYGNDTLNVAPPSYEISEAIRRDSQVDLPLPSAGSEKARFAVRYGNDSPQPPNTAPLSPPHDFTGGSVIGSSSTTMYD